MGKICRLTYVIPNSGGSECVGAELACCACRAAPAVPSAYRVCDHDPWRPRNRSNPSSRPPASLCVSANILTSGECARTCSRPREPNLASRMIPEPARPFADSSRGHENAEGGPDRSCPSRSVARSNPSLLHGERARMARGLPRERDERSGCPPPFSACLLEPMSGSVPFGTILLARSWLGRRARRARARGVAHLNSKSLPLSRF